VRILLLTPPVPSTLKRVLGVSMPPLGLAYLAASAGGHDVELIDPIAEELDLDSTMERIRRFQPQVVGISCTTPGIYGAYRVARGVKVWDPGVKVVLGGPHATFTARECLKECPELDVVVRGEADESFPRLLDAIERGRGMEDISGLTYRRGGVVRETSPGPPVSDLDSLPHPRYGLLPMEKYELDGIQYSALMTSRGCPFKCVYCSSSQLCGKMWRGHSPKRVVEDMRILAEDFGVHEIELLDDTFTLNRGRALEVCRLLRAEGLDVFWSCSSRVDTIDSQLAHEMSRAGCHTVYFGVESGDEDVLRSTGKGISLDGAVRAVSVAKEAGLHTVCSFILGLPQDTLQTVRRTIDFARRIGTDFAQFTQCTPFPGTKIYEVARKRGWLLTTDWSRYTTLDPVMRVPGIPPQLITKMMRRAYISFYLRPNFLLRQVREGRIVFLRKAISGAVKTYAARWSNKVSYFRQ